MINRRQLLALASVPLLGHAPVAAITRVQPMSIIEALEACGTVAENFTWAFEINACLGFKQVAFLVGDASGAQAGVRAAAAAVAMFEREYGRSLSTAPGAALVVQGHPDRLTEYVGEEARHEVRATASPHGYVLYALCPDESAGDQILVSLVVPVGA